MSTNRWMQSLVKDRADLYRAIYDWNAYPHRWALPAWLETVTANAVPAPAIALLEETSGGRERLSRHFRAVFALDETLWDFREPRRRLALLSATTLERLARFAGATLHSAQLARVITKADRRAVTDRIGEDAYAFALRHSPVTRVSDPVPHAAATDPRVQATDLTCSSIARAGWSALFACLADEPPALRGRFRLKTPRDLELSPAAAGTTPASITDNTTRGHAWAFLQPIARAIFSPEEQRCFA